MNIKINLTNTALAVIAFYLVIASNFLKELIGCNLQHILNNNMLAKHMIGFLLLVILIVVVNPVNSDLRIIEIIFLSICIYLWFIITTRSHYIFTIITLILLLIVYILDSTKKRYTDEKKIKDIENIQMILVISAVIMNIIGFTIYTIEKKKEYGKKFVFMDFLIGNPYCKNYTPNNAKII